MDADVPTNGLLGRQTVRAGLSPLPARPMSKGGAESSAPSPNSHRLSLNPLFVAWLMGWHWYLEGWTGSTSSASSETESSPDRPPMPSESSGPSLLERSDAA